MKICSICEIGRFSPSTMLCSPGITEDLCWMSPGWQTWLQQNLLIQKSAGCFTLLEFAVHSYLKTFSNKNYDSQQPCGMTETRELKQWWRRRKIKKKHEFLLPIIQICSVHPSVWELTQKKYKARERCEILTIVAHVLQITQKVVFSCCCFCRRWPGNVQDI